MWKAKHLVIKGRVQGVYYRDSTKAKALELGIKGWVRNLPNGDVEAMIMGDQYVLEEMLKWVWEGPSMAIVRSVIVNDVELDDGMSDFEIRH